MSRYMGQRGAYCYGPSTPGLRMLSLAGSFKVGVIGLDDILEDLYREGKGLNMDTVSEIVKRLENRNFIARGIQEKYEDAALSEFKKFCEQKRKEVSKMSKRETNKNEKKKGFLSRLFGRGVGGGCCNVQIAPKEELEELQGDEQFVGKKDKRRTGN